MLLPSFPWLLLPQYLLPESQMPLPHRLPGYRLLPALLQNAWLLPVPSALPLPAVPQTALPLRPSDADKVLLPRAAGLHIFLPRLSSLLLPPATAP